MQCTSHEWEKGYIYIKKSIKVLKKHTGNDSSYMLYKTIDQCILSAKSHLDMLMLENWKLHDI